MVALLLAASFTPVEGVQVHCAENTQGKSGRARVEVVVGAGALHEADDQHGVAHLLEHLLLRPLGFDDNNGATDWDRTRYFSDVRATELSTAAVRLVRAIRDAEFTEADLEIERRVVLRELTERGDTTLPRPMFGSTPLSRPIGGDARSVKGLSLDDLRGFHQAHHVRGNLAVLLLGADRCAETIERLRPELEAFAPGPAAKVPPITADHPGATRLPGQGFEAGFFWYDASPTDALVMRLVAKHLEQRALEQLRKQEGLAYTPKATYRSMGRAGLIAIDVKTSGASSQVSRWYDRTVAELRDADDPLALMAAAVDQVRRSFDSVSAVDALARLRDQPSPSALLADLDNPTLTRSLARMIAPDRGFGSGQKSLVEVLVLVACGAGILAFIGWLGRSLLRG